MTRSQLAIPALMTRRAGVLLHPTSLPGPLGALGREAHRFIDLLAESGATVWQMLPVGPTHGDRSPYHSLSANAGNPDLIDLELLVQWGFLSWEEVPELPSQRQRFELLHLAADRFFSPGSAYGAVSSFTDEYSAFVDRHQNWLPDYALFQVLRDAREGQAWQHWPQALRDRDASTLSSYWDQHAEAIRRICFQQFVFAKQWQRLKRHSRDKGVYLFGDIPIFVAHDSSDVWANRHLFKLNTEGSPLVVAGVPPDYFSDRGQHWGNPLYDWNAMAEDGFQWWLTRLSVQQQYFDLIRIDHFRGLVACWEIPAEAPEPSYGQWVQVPGYAFLEACYKAYPELALVAENLGLIGEDVEALRARFNLPGMQVLQFGFDGNANNPHLNHNHRASDVIYTGTHDNDTTLGWYRSLDQATRCNVDEYLGPTNDKMPWSLIRLAMQSVSCLAVFPMQDILALDSDSRLNKPGTSQGNWGWKLPWKSLDEAVINRLRHLVSLYGRLP